MVHALCQLCAHADLHVMLDMLSAASSARRLAWAIVRCSTLYIVCTQNFDTFIRLLAQYRASSDRTPRAPIPPPHGIVIFLNEADACVAHPSKPWPPYLLNLGLMMGALMAPRSTTVGPAARGRPGPKKGRQLSSWAAICAAGTQQQLCK